jgi:hypothetical protein
MEWQRDEMRAQTAEEATLVVSGMNEELITLLLWNGVKSYRHHYHHHRRPHLATTTCRADFTDRSFPPSSVHPCE